MAPDTSAAKYPVKKNDMVMVITGRERGKTGKVLKVIPADGRVIIERLNMVKRHSKPRGAASPGGIVEKEAPIAISNVMVFCERCNAPVRVGVKQAKPTARARAYAAAAAKRWVTSDGGRKGQIAKAQKRAQGRPSGQKRRRRRRAGGRAQGRGQAARARAQGAGSPAAALRARDSGRR